MSQGILTTTEGSEFLTVYFDIEVDYNQESVLAALVEPVRFGTRDWALNQAAVLVISWARVTVRCGTSDPKTVRMEASPAKRTPSTVLFFQHVLETE